MGIVAIGPSGIRQLIPYFVLRNPKHQAASRLYRQALKFAEKRVDRHNIPGNEYSVVTLTLAPEKWEKAIEIIRDTQRRLAALSEPGGDDWVHLLNIQLLRVDDDLPK